MEQTQEDGAGQYGRESRRLVVPFGLRERLGRLASVQQPLLALGRVGRNGGRVNLRARRGSVEADVFRHGAGRSSVVDQGLARHHLATVEGRRQLRSVGLRVSQSPSVAERMARRTRVDHIADIGRRVAHRPTSNQNKNNKVLSTISNGHVVGRTGWAKC